MNVRIRNATATDLDAINAIYNHYVQTSTCTYQEEVSTAQERAAWFASHGPAHPVTVAINDAGQVVAWGSLNPFHPRSAYRFTVENSVYVHPDFYRQGIGRIVLADLLERAKQIGHREILAVISADQFPSIELHRQMGFVETGLLRNVGFKFSRWLNVIYMQHSLPQQK